jgi:hypothetical protein
MTAKHLVSICEHQILPHQHTASTLLCCEMYFDHMCRQIQRDKDEFEAAAAKGRPLEEERGVSGAMARSVIAHD